MSDDVVDPARVIALVTDRQPSDGAGCWISPSGSKERAVVEGSSYPSAVLLLVHCDRAEHRSLSGEYRR